MSYRLTPMQRHAYDKAAAEREVPPADIPWGQLQVAEYLGVRTSTITTYMFRARQNEHADPSDFPQPDGWMNKNRGPWWYPRTVIQWTFNRPGQGVGGGPKPKR